MDSTSERLRASDPWLITAVAVGLALRLVGLDAAPLWLDEVHTAKTIAKPLETMLVDWSGNHPPLYPLLMKAWAGIAGGSAYALRLPSVLATLVAIPLAAFAGARLGGASVGRLTAWLTALSPYVLQHAKEARMYGLVAAFGAAHLLALARFATGASASPGWAFVFTAAALAATHYYGIFLVCGSLLALLLLRRPLGTWVAPALGAAAVVVAALASVTVVTSKSAGGAYAFGIEVLPAALATLVTGYPFLPSSEELHQDGLHAAVPYLPAIGAAVLAMAVCAWSALRRLPTAACIVVGATLAGAVAGPLAVRVVLGVPLNPRYFMPALAPLLVLLAAGMRPAFAFHPRAVATTALLALLLAGTALQLASPGAKREDIHGAERWLRAHVAADEPVYVTSYEMMVLARYHWPDRVLQHFPSPRTAVSAENVARLAADFPFDSRARAFYLVGREWMSDPEGRLLHALRADYESCGEAALRGIRIFCLLRPGADGAVATRAQSAR